jgi:hypothetical protein
MTLEDEAEALNRLLQGKTVLRVFRHRTGEVGFEFTDESRFFAHQIADGLECSVTGDNASNEPE